MAPNSSAPDWFTHFGKEVERIFTTKPTGNGRIVRPRHPRLVAGVCSGIALHFGWDANVLRILVLLFTLPSIGLLLLAYAAAWVIIPEGQYELPNNVGAPKF